MTSPIASLPFYDFGTSRCVYRNVNNRNNHFITLELAALNTIINCLHFSSPFLFEFTVAKINTHQVEKTSRINAIMSKVGLNQNHNSLLLFVFRLSPRCHATFILFTWIVARVPKGQANALETITQFVRKHISWKRVNLYVLFFPLR